MEKVTKTNIEEGGAILKLIPLIQIFLILFLSAFLTFIFDDITLSKNKTN